MSLRLKLMAAFFSIAGVCVALMVADRSLAALAVPVSPDRFNAILWRGISLGTGSLLLIAAFSYWIGDRIGRNLDELVAMTRRLRDGEPIGAPVAASREDEIGELATAFYSLSRRLELEKKRRREAQSVRKDWLSMLVHDFKNPLSVLCLSLGAMDMDMTDAERSRLVASGRNALFRLEGMVRDLLQVASIDHSGARIKREHLDAGRVLRIVQDEQAKPLSWQGRRLELDLDERTRGVAVLADRLIIQRVVANLIQNAQQNSPQGSTITLGARLSNDDVEFFVRDHGTGVPPELRETIFKKFRSFEESALNVGLGLAFCKLAAKKHGGRMKLRSEQGEGSEFIFALPRTSHPAHPIHIGRQSPAFPVTPPCVRVRTRRFGGLSIVRNSQSGQSK